MKPTKKRPAKRTTAKRAVKTGSIEHKLMRLRNRIDEKQTSEMKHIDKQWVETLLSDIRNKIFSKLCKEDYLKCNGLWRTYA